jgi:putative transposase
MAEFKPPEKRGVISMANSLAHKKAVCKYHIVFTPKYSVSSFMGYMKGKSALMIFDRHANLKYKYGNRHFWARGYYVSTVWLNEATIAKYVREQEKNDQMMDQVSTKEARGS